jgi:predicted amidophosphoribosyltransferase
MSVAEIIKGIDRVEEANAKQRYATPEGRFPCCKNRVGTMICERCENHLDEHRGQACPAIPADQRWDVRYD